MKIILKVIAGIISLILIAYISFIIFVNTGDLTNSECKEEYSRVYSPSKEYAAYYLRHICPPDNELRITVIVHDKGMKKAYSVFKATSKNTDLKLNFNWKDNNNLLIKYPKNTNVTYMYNTTLEKIVNVSFREYTS